jgi:UPF0716 protein FxsA
VARLILVFVGLPALDLALLIEIGRRIGTAPTLALILLTGMLGASLARWQGLGVVRRVQADLARGELPAGALLDGVIILLGSALLITPGVVTDALGLLCLVPAFRTVLRRWMRRRFETMVAEQRVHVWMHFEDGPGAAGPVRDVTPEPGERRPIRLPPPE